MRQAALRLIKSASPPEMASPGHFVASAIGEYLLTKRQEGRSPDTIKQYTLRLGQFAQWLESRDPSSSSGGPVVHLSDLSRLLLREWGASLNPSWAPATTRHAITIVNGFLNWCLSEGLIIEWKLTTALRVPKAKRRIQRVLSDDEIGRLLDTCDGTMFGLRDAAIVSLMIDSGLRASEVCRLKKSDLIFDFPLANKLVNFIPVIGKGGNQELVYFGEATAARLRAWLAVRVAKPGVETVFVSLGGPTPLRTLTREGLYYALGDLGKRAGVPGVTPHSLRRSFALLLDEAGHTTRQIQALGRWSDIRMVERYTQSLRTAKLYQSPVDLLKRSRY